MIKKLTTNQILQAVTATLLMSLFLFALFNSQSEATVQAPKAAVKTVKLKPISRPQPIAKRAVKSPIKIQRRSVASIPKSLPKKTVKAVQTRHTFSFDREIASNEKKVVVKKSRKIQGARSSESSI